MDHSFFKKIILSCLACAVPAVLWCPQDGEKPKDDFGANLARAFGQRRRGLFGESPRVTAPAPEQPVVVPDCADEAGADCFSGLRGAFASPTRVTSCCFGEVVDEDAESKEAARDALQVLMDVAFKKCVLPSPVKFTKPFHLVGPSIYALVEKVLAKKPVTSLDMVYALEEWQQHLSSLERHVGLVWFNRIPGFMGFCYGLVIKAIELCYEAQGAKDKPALQIAKSLLDAYQARSFFMLFAVLMSQVD